MSNALKINYYDKNAEYELKQLPERLRNMIKSKLNTKLQEITHTLSTAGIFDLDMLDQSKGSFKIDVRVKELQVPNSVYDSVAISNLHSTEATFEVYLQWYIANKFKNFSGADSELFNQIHKLSDAVLTLTQQDSVNNPWRIIGIGIISDSKQSVYLSDSMDMYCTRLKIEVI